MESSTANYELSKPSMWSTTINLVYQHEANGYWIGYDEDITARPDSKLTRLA